MANLKATTFAGTGYLRLPVGNTAARPDGYYTAAAAYNTPTATYRGSMRINSTTGFLEYYNGGAWESAAIAFPYRQIITTAFMQGGYKNSTAWKNVNRTITTTDITINLGDITERAHNYQWGACSRDYSYVFGAGDGHAVSSNYTQAFNMRTEVNVTDISRTLGYSRHTFGGVFQEDRFAFLCGGPTDIIEEYNMYTKTLVGTLSPTSPGGNTWGMSHENYGIVYGNGQRTFTYSTRTTSARAGDEPGAHHQQKSINSKFTYGYAGNTGGYSGSSIPFRRTNFTTNVSNSASLTALKPWPDCGEENYTLGQDWQYMLGQHDPSGQNNRSHKWTYATETGVTGGADLEPKGHDGMSSAVGGWTD